MARPQRNNVDYFPFICKEGKAMFYIENKYGNDGFAVWVKILRQLAVTNYHYINLSDKTELMYLSAKCKVDENTLTEIIKDLVNLGEFNDLLWSENSIIWSDKFIDNIQDAYKKRSNKCVSFESLLTLLEGLGVRKPSKRTSKGYLKPHSKEENSKGDNSIGSKNHKMIDWLEATYPTIQKLKEPITNEQAEKLKQEFHQDFIIELFGEMENKKDLLKKYNSANLTFRSWARMNGRYEKWKSANGIFELNMNL